MNDEEGVEFTGLGGGSERGRIMGRGGGYYSLSGGAEMKWSKSNNERWVLEG
jgi:hypothetical protein